MNAQKIIVVGGVATGASTVARLRRLDETCEIILIERGEYISFANCGLPYYISHVIQNRDDLVLVEPELMRTRFNVDVRLRTEALSIDRKKKTLALRNLETEEDYTESYDYLVLATGAEPIKPDIPGAGLEGVFTLRNIPEMDAIITWIKERKVTHAVIAGAGFVGLEMAEALVHHGIKVIMLVSSLQVMRSLDPEMAAIIHLELERKGVEVALGTGVERIEDFEDALKIFSSSGTEFKTDMLIFAKGFAAETGLALEAGLEVDKAIVADDKLFTSDPYILTGGAAAMTKDFISGGKIHNKLAGPANRQGRTIANNIAGREEIIKGGVNSTIIKVFDLSVAYCGLNDSDAMEQKLAFRKVYSFGASHALYYPGADMMAIKLIFNEEGLILGAQIVGKDGVDKRIDVLSTALQAKFTVFDLENLELTYAPPYSSAKDPVNIAGMIAGNLVRGDGPAISWDEVMENLDEYCLVDVRTRSEFKFKHVDGAVNIPLNELRSRLGEIDKSKKVLLYCFVGARGYLASRILLQNGFDCANLLGGVRMYKYFEKVKSLLSENANL